MNAAPRAASISAVAALVLAAVWLFWPRRSAAGRRTSPRTASAWSPASTPGTWRSCARPARTPSGMSSRTAATSLDTIVMHRIVAGDGERFVTQGDNNDWLDGTGPPRTRSSAASSSASPRGQGARRPRSPGQPRRGRRRPRSRARRRPRSARRRNRARDAGAARRPSFSMPTRALARQVALGSAAVVAARGGRVRRLLAAAGDADRDPHRGGGPAGPVLLRRRGRGRHHLPDGRRSPPATPSGRGSQRR